MSELTPRQIVAELDRHITTYLIICHVSCRPVWRLLGINNLFDITEGIA